jgi:hypothetical protein
MAKYRLCLECKSHNLYLISLVEGWVHTGSTSKIDRAVSCLNQLYEKACNYQRKILNDCGAKREFEWAQQQVFKIRSLMSAIEADIIVEIMIDGTELVRKFKDGSLPFQKELAAE